MTDLLAIWKLGFIEGHKQGFSKADTERLKEIIQLEARVEKLEALVAELQDKE